MKHIAPILAVVTLAAVGGALALRKKKHQAPASRAPPADTAATRVGELAPVVVPPAAVGEPAAPPKELPKFTGALATAAAGIAVNNALGDAVERFGGKGKGDTTRVLGPLAAAGFAADKAISTGLARVGVPQNTAKHIAQTAVATAFVGAPAITLKLGAEGISKGIGLIAGKKAEKAVRSSVSKLDPTKPGSITNKFAVAPAAKLVKGIGGLFHKKK